MNSLPTAYWLFLSALVLGSVLGVGALLDGVEVDAALDADVETDVEGDMDADANAEGDGSGSAEAHGGGFWAALGVGRAPLGLLLALDLLLFGGLGVVGAESLALWWPRSLAATLWLPIALVGGVYLGARGARFLARRLPTEETYAVSRDALIGQIARAELDIDARFGRAKVTDDGGALHFVRCRSTGSHIAAGTELVLTDRDPETGVYTAVAADLMGRDSARSKLC
jgi:membrane protein implicated in regulation of membrane protease activity